jgi:general secretion pathway protein D
MNKTVRYFMITVFATSMLGCATKQEKKQLPSSYLSGGSVEKEESDKVVGAQDVLRTKTNFNSIETIDRGEISFSSNQLSKSFSQKKLFQISAKDMQLQDFLQYVLGELLNVNYLITPSIKTVNSPVTLNIGNEITEQRLFELTEEVLSERGIAITLAKDVYLVAKIDPNSKNSTRVGVGRDAFSVPSSNGTILQIVPILYGVKTTLKRTIEELTDVQITIDAKQSTLFVRGNNKSIIRALELIQLLDSPAIRGRQIGMVELAFVDVDLYLQQMSLLLENEGIPNSIGSPGNDNLVFVPLPQIGTVAIFSATQKLLERVKFWSKTLDKPSQGDVKQYYIYHPKYARASDIGDSLTPLLNASTASIKSTSRAQENSTDTNSQGSGQLKTTNRSAGASNERMTLVVDERSNALIFFSTGTDYKNILSLIQKLDVLPQQVLLEVVIAEVNLVDDFKFGVEWAMTRGDVSAGTSEAFSVGEIGGLNLLSLGASGDFIKANFFDQNQNINILSRPSLLVRDGVSASIEIGAEISVIGSTTDNLNSGTGVQTTSSEYISTGIAINVTPTVNAQGIVIMAITQSLSNTVPNSSGAGGNPSIFKRNLSTEVVAESGQTIILAGLIDERDSETDTKVPFLGDLPLIGNIFKSKGNNKTKTELVLMITPKVISRTEQWTDIMSSFKSTLVDIELEQ